MAPRPSNAELIMTTPSPHILIVSGFPKDTVQYRHFLSSGTTSPFIIDSATSGEEGLQRAITDRPDCILLDFHLPDMTGIEFLENLPFLEGKPLMPIIMLTSEGSEALAVKSIKNGAEDYLVKSQLTQSSLQITVMGAIANATLQRSMREHRAHLNISQILSTTDTLERATPTLLHEIGSTMNWQICIMWATDDHSHELYCLGLWHSPTLICSEFLEFTNTSRLSFGEDLPGRAWATSQFTHLTSSTQLEACPRSGLLPHNSMSGAFAIPIRSHSHVSVILEGWYAHPRDVSPERFAMMNAIGRQVTQFLKHAHIERNLIQRESEYRLVTNHVPALLASFDADGRFRLANQQYLDWFGGAEDQFIGRFQEEILGKALYEHVRPYVEQTLRGQQTNFEWRIPSVNGETRWVQANYIPEAMGAGKINGFYFFASNITQRKQIEERLRQQAQELARSNAELEQFAHIASHDLQEPLRKVQAFSDRLRTRCTAKLDAQELEYLERMHNATGRMQTLIRDLLTFSRVGSNTKPFQPIDLSVLVKEVLSDLETLVIHFNASVYYPDLPVIEADYTQMRQLFQNLIGNALKFHKPETSPIIHIEASLNHSPASSSQVPLWTITIRDNGIGFEQRYADRIFGLFQRLHGRNEYEGTGIGLSICQKVMDRHHGNISVSSVPGQGTSFFLTLPASQPRLSSPSTHSKDSTHFSPLPSPPNSTAMSSTKDQAYGTKELLVNL